MSDDKFPQKPYIKAKRFCEKGEGKFRSDSDILDLALALFEA